MRRTMRALIAVLIGLTAAIGAGTPAFASDTAIDTVAAHSTGGTAVRVTGTLVWYNRSAGFRDMDIFCRADHNCLAVVTFYSIEAGNLQQECRLSIPIRTYANSVTQHEDDYTCSVTDRAYTIWHVQVEARDVTHDIRHNQSLDR